MHLLSFLLPRDTPEHSAWNLVHLWYDFLMTKSRSRRKSPPSGLTPQEVFSWFLPGSPPEEGCWFWKEDSVNNWYGTVWFAGRYRPTHQFSYIVHHGPIPRGMFVIHTCDNKGCVHPNHLKLGTRRQNTDEAMERDRYRKGEGVPTSKLTEKQVLEIRAGYASGSSIRDLMNQFGIADSTVYGVVTHRSWKHI